MSVFGKGWKPDLDDHITECRLGLDGASSARCDEHNPRYGASARMPKEYDGLSAFASYRDQRFSSACVGFTIAEATRTRLRLLGYDIGPLSALVPYAIARQLEGLYKNKPLPDDGCHPFLAMRGVRKHGLVVEALWPFGDDYEKMVTKEIPVDILSTASQFRVASFSRIEDEGEARVHACKAALLAKHPVLLGMQVGREFEAYRPGLGPVGIEVGNTGGHMTYLVGYEDDGEVFIGCNSWGRGYGDGGKYRIHKSKLTHASTTDLYDFEVAASAA